MNRPRPTFVIVCGSLFVTTALLTVLSARERTPQVREVSIDGDHYAFSPARIEVQKDEVVKVSFHARDIAHSFALDAYRIVKRAAAGQTVTFEFRADQAGTFPFYCNLSQDERCRQMRGELVVR
jgi:heme/copper-type cytochrome/quinol oxidase subunit 2